MLSYRADELVDGCKHPHEDSFKSNETGTGNVPTTTDRPTTVTEMSTEPMSTTTEANTEEVCARNFSIGLS